MVFSLFRSRKQNSINDSLSTNKAEPTDFLGRFREICSDPLNLLIERSPLAGSVLNGFVVLHNGNRVPKSGDLAYYGSFSDILVINRGVHEPLEEYIFQQLLTQLNSAPTMLELGAYWAHYSMWLKRRFEDASVWMVEPDENNLKAGQANFQNNGLSGTFVKDFVGQGHFTVDSFFQRNKLQKLTILHSDIQGFEVEMLEGAREALSSKKVDYLFVSTHSQELHSQIIHSLKSFGYRIEVTADFENETTSFDGLVFASSSEVPQLFVNFHALGRNKLTELASHSRLTYLNSAANQTSASFAR